MQTPIVRSRSRSRSRPPETYFDPRSVEAFKPLPSKNSAERVKADLAKKPINSPWNLPQRTHINTSGSTTISTSTVNRENQQLQGPLVDPRLNRASNLTSTPLNAGQNQKQSTQHNPNRLASTPLNTGQKQPTPLNPNRGKWAAVPPTPLNKCHPQNFSMQNNTSNGQMRTCYGLEYERDEENQGDAPPPNLHSYESMSANRSLSSNHSTTIHRATADNHKPVERRSNSKVRSSPAMNKRTAKRKQPIIQSDDSDDNDSADYVPSQKSTRANSVLSNTTTASQRQRGIDRPQSSVATTSAFPTRLSANDWVQQQIALGATIQRSFSEILPRKISAVREMQQHWDKTVEALNEVFQNRIDQYEDGRRN